MTEVISRSAVQDLADLHWLLDGHFSRLREERSQLSAAAPVFALEHGRGDDELDHLQQVVRSAVRQGLGAEFRKWWIPFTVYAAESGYKYDGGEYWQTFEEATPGWENSNRNLIRRWFTKFADDYGGARPQGAFADYFPIIAWPITHAVLPVHLQRNLARLLFGFRTGLTADLLEDPGALGERLAARTGEYTERFRIFCQNTSLLGQVSAALLSGGEEESPYLLRSTLHRLVAGLSAERESRQWLDGARASARRARTRVGGLVPRPRPPGRAGHMSRLPAPTDPRLVLRRTGRAWGAFAELPDLAPVLARLPHLADELRTRRAHVAGAERPFLAPGQLLYPGYEVQLARWPQPGEPFISLKGGTGTVNQLIADQCILTPGPSWLFHCQARGLAVEVKGKTARPGHSYVLVTGPEADAPWLSWVRRVEIEAEGVRAFEITVPEVVTDSDAAALAAAGISLTSRIAVRPAGITASVWDGEGAVEWRAGEPCMIAISTNQAPEACMVALDGQHDTVPWPQGQRELLLMLEDLSAGTCEVSVSLTAADGETIANGSLLVTIRDPQDRPDGGSAGEGIRMLADPARPTLSELWDGRASLSVDGPNGEQATLTVTLLPETGTRLAVIERTCALPLSPGKWSQTATGIRSDARFRNAYDDAESTQVTVGHAGVGLASLTCDRGFQPLRWRIARVRGAGKVARLADRTDGGHTTVDLFHVEDPLVPVSFRPAEDIPIPACGGLVRAVSGPATAAMVLPTDPNEVMRLGSSRPRVETGAKTPREVEHLATAWHWWNSADRPADPFAQHEVDAVLDAITSAVASLLGGGRWGQAERHAQGGYDTTALLREMERCVGESSLDRALARAIGGHLRVWDTREQLRRSYPDLVARPGTLRTAVTDPVTARFTLALADQPGLIITDWSPAERDEQLSRVLARPMLFRAARFAVLGARGVHQPPGQASITGDAR